MSNPNKESFIDEPDPETGAAGFDTVKKGKKMRTTRYRTPEEITAKVDKANDKIRLYTEQAVAAEQEYHTLLREGARADAEMRKDKAEKLWAMVDYQINRRLPKLRDRMGKIQTDLLPFENNHDRSVPA